MVYINDILMWEVFNKYMFIESSHKYYYNNLPVKYSVTQFINKFFEPFDLETISSKYAQKHGLTQEEVLQEWDKKVKIASTTGTIIHSYMENLKRGKIFDLDFSLADKLNIRDEVQQRTNVLLPQAKAFHEDTLNKLFPIKLEYTVGIEDYIAGNIDMLCWNNTTKEVQIWDYKSVKQINTKPNYYTKNCYYPFDNYFDINYVHYSVQLNIYKNILQRYVDVKIGNCFLVVFNYEHPQNGFEVIKCLDLQPECNIALNMLLNGEVV